MKYFITYYLFFSILTGLFAQESDVERLDEVKIFGHLYKQELEYYILNDSLIRETPLNTSDLFRDKFNLYIKEYGRGMTASISLRGAKAAHTGVYWNGVPINSRLNGQADINSLFLGSFDRIMLKKGGGSTTLGSGAMAGAINLTNSHRFQDSFGVEYSTEIGSYQSFKNSFKLKNSSLSNSLITGIEMYSSKNNYPFLGTDLSNENGEIATYSLHVSDAQKLGAKQLLYVNTLFNISDRNNPATLYAPSKSKLNYRSTNMMLGWLYQHNLFTTEIKSAKIIENYRYLMHRDTPENASDNSADAWYNQIETKWKPAMGNQIISGGSFEYVKAKGTDLLNISENKYALYIQYTNFKNTNLQYKAGIRKEWTTHYKIPWVFSTEFKYKLSDKNYLKTSLSTNYKTPTLNDLYWNPGGNIDLEAEQNFHGDFSIFRKNNNSHTVLSIFYQRNRNLIQWQPVTTAVWKPFNVKNTYATGFEFESNRKFKFGFINLMVNMNYTYTYAIDMDANSFLMYVPKHLAVVSFDATMNKISIGKLLHYTSDIFTVTDQSQNLPGYFLADFYVGKKMFKDKFYLRFDVKNVFNKYYEITAGRPMPNRNFNLNLIYKY